MFPAIVVKGFYDSCIMFDVVIHYFASAYVDMSIVYLQHQFLMFLVDKVLLELFVNSFILSFKVLYCILTFFSFSVTDLDLKLENPNPRFPNFR